MAIGIASFAVLKQVISNAPPIPPPGSGVQYWQIPNESFIPKGLQAIGLCRWVSVSLTWLSTSSSGGENRMRDGVGLENRHLPVDMATNIFV